MVEAIIQHVESVDASGLKEGSVFTVSKAISYDRPDLFWYNNCTYTEDKILLKYGAIGRRGKSCKSRWMR